MKYKDAITAQISDLIRFSNTLPPAKGSYFKKSLKNIINWVNNEIEKRQQMVEIKHGLKSGQYQDTLDFCINILGLHGYTDLEVQFYFTPEFVDWFIANVMTHPRYVPQRMTSQMLLAFAEGYRTIRLMHDREPESYAELRNYVVQFDDIKEQYADQLFKEAETLKAKCDGDNQFG